MPASNHSAEGAATARPLLTQQEEASARMLFAIEQGLRLALLFGPPGAGKTLLLAKLAANCLRTGLQVAQVSLAGRSESEVLFAILAAWGLNPPVAASVAQLWRMVSDHLTALRWQDRRAVLFLDDAAAGLPNTLAALQRLFALESAARTITIIAAAENFSRGKLPRGWLEIAELRADLEPLLPEETASFVTRKDGANQAAPHFTPDAIAALHTLTEGLPRRLDQLQRLIVIAAEGNPESAIDAATVEQVYRELFIAPR